MRHRRSVTFIATVIATATLISTANAVTVTPINHAGSASIGGVTTFYWATKVQPAAIVSSPTTAPVPSPAGCTGQVGPIALNVPNPPPVLDMSVTGTARKNSGVMVFSITNSTPLATIAAGSSGVASIRAEYTSSQTSGPSALPLIDVAGLSYTVLPAPNPPGTQHVTELSFATDHATVQFGIPIGDLVANEFTLTQDSNTGFCHAFATATAGSTDFAHFCAPSAGVAPTSVTINIGIMPAGQSLGATGADATGTSGAFNIVLADCPPGATGGDPTGVQTFTTPTFNMTAQPGDQRVVLQNNSQAISDPVSAVVPITGVLVVADTSGNNLTLGSPIQRPITGNFGGPGSYTVTGLANDTQWCFTVADVNAAGWPTMNASWGTGGVFASPSPSVCATPSQIDGFLDRSTCFIATAAYGAEWDPRLEVLRQFRDQILDTFAPGRAFVDWYYSWSPQAAHWLLANPGYRSIVRVFLLPVVEGARVSLWMRSNMWVFGIAFVLGTVAALAVGLRRRTTS